MLNTTGFTLILNQLEQEPIYHAYNFSMPSSNAVFSGSANVTLAGLAGGAGWSNTTVVGTLISTFACPSDDPPVTVNDTTGTAGTQFIRNNARRSNYVLCSSHYIDSDSPWAIPGRPQRPGRLPVRLLDEARRHQGRVEHDRAWSVRRRQVKVDSVLRPYWAGGAGPRLTASSSPSSAKAIDYMPNAPASAASGWSQPNPQRLQNMWAMGSRHSGGLNMLFADGSVHFLKDSINNTIWYGLQTVRNREVIGSDAY